MRRGPKIRSATGSDKVVQQGPAGCLCSGVVGGVIKLISVALRMRISALLQVVSMCNLCRRFSLSPVLAIFGGDGDMWGARGMGDIEV